MKNQNQSERSKRTARASQYIPRLLARREQFLLCVYSGAVARDIAQDSNDAQLIARAASEIPPARIPNCPVNAASVFLNYCYGGRTRPFRWMFEADGKG